MMGWQMLEVTESGRGVQTIKSFEMQLASMDEKTIRLRIYLFVFDKLATILVC